MDLTLTVDAVHGRTIEGTVELDSPTSSAPGSFRVKGSFDTASGMIRLAPDGWVDEMPGMSMFTLQGKVTNTSTFRGRAQGGRCTSFQLSMNEDEDEDG